MNAVSAPLRFLINVEQFHRMGEAGIIPPDTRVELIERKVPLYARHGVADAPIAWGEALG